MRPTLFPRVLALLVISIALLCLGALLGSGGIAWNTDSAIVFDIRLPRSAGAWLAGALLGLAGAIAQGVFRNPLADPYLLGSASGALMGVALVLGFSHAIADSGLALIGLNSGAFIGALLGVVAALILAGGYRSSLRLLLSGVVISVILGAGNALFTFVRPDLYQRFQAFMLGNTSLLDWHGVYLMLLVWLAVLQSLLLSTALNALSLGESTAKTLGLPIDQMRLGLIAVLALATGAAVAQTGLIAFIGLAAPHLVRRFANGSQRMHLLMSSLAGGILLLASDLLARTVLAPLELPVGIVTAVLGGSYLLLLLRRQALGISA
jgi:iron complex transport system permease protein